MTNNLNTKDKNSVKTWCLTYDKQESESYKDKWFNEHLKIVRQYMPLDKKLFYVNRLVQLTTHPLKNGEVDLNTLKVNTPTRYVLYNLTLVDLYTHLDVDFSNTSQEYDYLKQYGVLEKILQKIPQSEIIEFKNLLKMSLDDAMTNEYESHAYLSKLVNNVTVTLGTLLSKDMSGLTEALKSMSGEDLSELKKSLLSTAKTLETK